MKTALLVIAIVVLLACVVYFLYKKLTKNRAKLANRERNVATYVPRKAPQMFLESDRSGYGSVGTTYPTSYPTPPKRVVPKTTPPIPRDRVTWDDDAVVESSSPAVYDYGSSDNSPSCGGSSYSPSYDSGSSGSSDSSSSSDSSGSSCD